MESPPIEIALIFSLSIAHATAWRTLTSRVSGLPLDLGESQQLKLSWWKPIDGPASTVVPGMPLSVL